MAGKTPGRADATAGKAASGMSLAQNAMAFAAAAIVAAGVGVFEGYQAANPAASAPTAKSAAAMPGDGGKVSSMAEIGSMDLPPVVTNLASPSDVWVRLEATLLFEGKTLPHGEALAGEIAGDILAYMRTETLAQIQGVAGLEHLRQDLNERVSIRSEGRVRALIIRSLVVQ